MKIRHRLTATGISGRTLFESIHTNDPARGVFDADVAFDDWMGRPSVAVLTLQKIDRQGKPYDMVLRRWVRR